MLNAYEARGRVMRGAYCEHPTQCTWGSDAVRRAVELYRELPIYVLV